MTIASCNARSLRKNVDYITQYIIEHDIDLLTITETWLTDIDQYIINDITFNSAIYTCYRCDRITSTFGGGVAIFLKNNMTVYSNKHIILTNCQALFLKIKINHLSIFDILLVYRPPSTPTQLFTSELTHILTQIPLNKLIILGDFNYHYDENKYPHIFKQTIETLSLKQHITFTTHIHGHIIDIVLTSINSQIYISEITRGELITDHYMIKFNINIKKNVPIVKLIKYRSINKINIKDFIDNILSSLEGNILSSLLLNDCLTSTLNKFAPIKRLNITYHAHSPWYNNELEAMKRKLRRFEKNI